MAANVPRVKLEHVSDMLSGATPSKARPEFWGSDIPWVSAKDMRDRRLRDTEDHITLAGLASGSRLAPASATLVLTRGMTLLTDVPICALDRDVAFNQDLKAIVPRAEIEPAYLTYALLAAKQELLSMVELAGHGTGRLPTDRLKALEIPLPSRSEQRAIAHILGTLDKKIELNRRMIETLEAMARAIFQSWFVDFDPVRVKAEGRNHNLPKPLADLLPDLLEDSELGEIPARWSVGRFGDVAEVLRDQDNPLESPNTLFFHHSIPAFDEGQRPKPEYGENIKSLKFRVPAGVVLLSKLNPEIERVWLVDVRPDERAVCSTEFLVLLARTPFTRSYVYCLVRSPLFRRQIEALVTGTSKSHQRAQAESVLNLSVVVPPPRVVKAFERSVANALARTLECRRESATLAALRDTLLPKLIAGELRVNDAERFIRGRA